MSRFRSWKMDAYNLHLFRSGASSLLFALIFTASAIYQVQTVGLSPLQLVLVGTMLEVTAFLFEIPTGVVADVYSRRLSIIIGFVLMGAGFMVEGLFHTFAAVLLCQFLWGVVYTFTSGASQAWITDEIGEENVGRAFMRGSQVGRIGGIIGMVLAILLGSIHISLPIVLGGFLLVVLAGFFALVMPENGFRPTPREERNTWGQMTGALKDGVKLVRGRPTVLAIMGIGLFLGLFSEGYDRLNTKHLLESFSLPSFGGLQPIAWMGILSIIGDLLAAGVMQLVMKRLDTAKGSAMARASYLLSGLMVGTLMGFALAGNFWLAVVLWHSFGIARSLFGPIEETWINQHIDSNVRATVNSMRSQVDAFGQMFGGPPVGLVGERFGVRAALLTSAAVLSPVLFLYPRILRRENRGEALEAEALSAAE